MNEVIFKFPLLFVPRQSVSLFNGAHLLSVKKQGDQFCLWAMVDPGNDEMTVDIEMFGTGQPIIESGDRRYIDTCIDGEFVWHFFSNLES